MKARAIGIQNKVRLDCDNADGRQEIGNHRGARLKRFRRAAFSVNRFQGVPLVTQRRRFSQRKLFAGRGFDLSIDLYEQCIDRRLGFGNLWLE